MTYSPKEREIPDQVVAALHGHYGERLSRVVLFGEAAYECREALECGGLTPLFLPRDSASSVARPSQAKQRLTVHRSSELPAPKVKAGSSPRTPKASAKLGNRSARRVAKVVSDFSRQIARKENAGTLRRNHAPTKLRTQTQSHIATTKVADYFAPAAARNHFVDANKMVRPDEAAYECREALECGGLTPLFLPRDSASSVERPSQAKQRITISRLTKSTAPKVKAVSSHRTPKASAKLGNRSAMRGAKVVHDFSRPNRRKESAGTLRRNHAPTKLDTKTQNHITPTKVADYLT